MIQKQQNHIQQAIQDREQTMEDQRRTRTLNAQRQQQEEDKIKQYQQEQDKREAERKEATKFRQSTFEALLQKMADQNKQRENRLQKMENLRIEIA